VSYNEWLARAAAALHLAGHTTRLKILMAVERHGSRGSASVAELLCCTRTFAGVELLNLAQAGLLEPEPRGAELHYFLTPAGRAVIAVAQAFAEVPPDGAHAVADSPVAAETH
jgi:DNA-binding MarR family transcriptional regulator